MYDDNKLLLCGLVVSSAVKYVWLSWLRRKRRAQMRVVGEVTALYMYPFKSGRGVELGAARCEEAGFRNQRLIDRQFLVSRGTVVPIVSAREEPTLILVSLREDGGHFVVDAPGMEPLRISRDNVLAPPNTVIPYIRRTRLAPLPWTWGRVFEQSLHGRDLGDEAARWFNVYLGFDDCRLFAYSESHSKRYLSNIIKPWFDEARPGDQVALADFGAYLVTSEESLVDINSHLSHPVPMKRFRPNIVIKGSAGFSEDKWRDLQIGEIRFRYVDMCTRCGETTVDTETGVKSRDGEPLKTLLALRSDVTRKGRSTFGIYVAPDNTGTIRVGDIVRAI